MRRSRAPTESRKHEAAAHWIEGIAGERVADHAELLAHHYREALALARAAGLETTQLEDGARRFLALAAERAAAVDLRRAADLFAEALELTPPGHPARGRLLTESIETAGRFAEGEIETLEEALAELRAAGDEVGLGKAMLVLSHRVWMHGDTARATEVLEDAVELLERHEPGPELAHAYSLSAGRQAIGGDAQAALDWAEKAAPLSERLGLGDVSQRTLQFRGMARARLGDLGGVDDLRESLHVSLERGLTRAAVIAFNNYGSWVWLTAGAAEALPIYTEGIEFVERRGGRPAWHRGESTWPLFDAGRWEELLETARLLEEDELEGQPLLMALASKGRVLFYRGRTEEAAVIASDLLPRARAAADAQIVLPTLSLAALAALVEPRPDAALALVTEMLTVDAPENPSGVREQAEEARRLFRSLGAGPLEREAAELLERVAA